MEFKLGNLVIPGNLGKGKTLIAGLKRCHTQPAKHAGDCREMELLGQSVALQLLLHKSGVGRRVSGDREIKLFEDLVQTIAGARTRRQGEDAGGWHRRLGPLRDLGRNRRFVMVGLVSLDRSGVPRGHAT